MDDSFELGQFSVCVMTCVFRTCNWTSEDTRSLSIADQEHIVTEHLQHHRSEIRLMYKAIG